ncbi:Ubiquitin-conjugating enzyme E2 J1 [Nowakowskiella sp. JEL0407]|nr:Ubiquitin-conjugating enzyme E2 J1 [Nowakowskiella sp. JEL0407]
MALIFLTVIHGLIVLVHAIEFSPLPINWDKVPTTLDTTSFQRDLEICQCDLTVGRCDINCCCDKDCNAIQQNSLFRGGCLPSGENVPLISRCSDQILIANNLDQSRSILSQDENGVTCIVVNNSPVQGLYYQDASAVADQATFNDLTQYKSFSPNANIYDMDMNSMSPSFYKSGDPIKVAFNSSNSQFGFFNIPQPSASTECNDLNPARFLVDTESICTRMASNFNLSCARGTELDLDRYWNGIKVISDPASPSILSNVTLSSIQCVDLNTGIASDCIGGIGLLFGNTCVNALSEITYSFYYNITAENFTTLTNVDVQAKLATFNLSTLALATQKFITKFISVSMLNDSLTQTEQVTEMVGKIRSGNPGYITGLPILSGKLATNSTLSAIEYSPDPLSGITLLRNVPAIDTISCPLATDPINRIPVTFNEDIITGCTKYYNFDDINLRCDEIRKEIYKLQTLTLENLSHVAKFGNASYLNVNEWIMILKPSSQSVDGSQITLGDTPGTCSNVLTSLDIKFIVANFGSKKNPQKGIVGAQVQYISGYLRYKCSYPLDCTVTGRSKLQAFQISSSVTWVDLPDQTTNMFIPPPPKLIPSLPDDIFYPFQLSGSLKNKLNLYMSGVFFFIIIIVCHVNSAVKRLMKEYQDLQNDPCPEFVAAPLEDDIFEWHFTIRGPPDGGFLGGRYHGRIIFPADYPFKPPNISFLTPNGRFEVGKKICLSITGYHPEYWRPAWGVRLALVAIISFFPTKGDGAIGSLDYTEEERKIFAKKSRLWSCPSCRAGKNEDLLPDESQQPTVKLEVDPEITLTVKDQDTSQSKAAESSPADPSHVVEPDTLTTNASEKAISVQEQSGLRNRASVTSSNPSLTNNPTVATTVMTPPQTFKRHHIDIALFIVLFLLAAKPFVDWLRSADSDEEDD